MNWDRKEQKERLEESQSGTKPFANLAPVYIRPASTGANGHRDLRAFRVLGELPCSTTEPQRQSG